MDKYRVVEKPRVEAELKPNEIRITTQGKMRNSISYATTLFKDKGETEVVLKAMGRAINKTVTIAEIIKRRIAGLHQITVIDSTDITDVYEPIEEGLDRLETTRHVSSITITLSTAPLDTSAPGYQPPIPDDQVKEITLAQKGRTAGRGRGRGRRGPAQQQQPQQSQQPQQPVQQQQSQQSPQQGFEQGDTGARPRGRGRGRRPRTRRPRSNYDNAGEFPNDRQGGNDNRQGGNTRQGGNDNRHQGGNNRPQGGRPQGGYGGRRSQGGAGRTQQGGFSQQQGPYGGYAQGAPQGGSQGGPQGGRGRGNKRPRGRGRGMRGPRPQGGYQGDGQHNSGMQ